MDASWLEADLVAVYRDARGRLIELVRSLPPDSQSVRVPACPDWTVRDIVAHLIGASEDFVVSNFPGAGTPIEAWAAAQVARRSEMPMPDLLAEWEGVVPAVLEGLEGGWIPARPLINDTAVHDQDIRCALGIPGGLDAPGYRYAIAAYTGHLGSKITKASLPALALRSEEGEVMAGEGEPLASVAASFFELSRAISGRRSVAQMARYAWTGYCEPYLPLFPAFTPPKSDLVEDNGVSV
jgi:uncharacterized protein (TIGR03083 family)